MKIIDGKPASRETLVSFCLYLCGYGNSLLFLCPCIERPVAYCFTVCLSVHLSVTNLNCKLNASLLLLNY